MLMPKRVKFRRVQRGRLTGKALRGNRALLDQGKPDRGCPYRYQQIRKAWR